MAGLRRPQPSKNHDAQGARVYPKVPPSCLALPLCANTPFRSAGQQNPQRHHWIMSEDPRRCSNPNPTKRQERNLAGAVAQDLRDRCHYLSRLPERKNVYSGTSTALSMQQSTGVILMNPLTTAQTIVSGPCENDSLFRQGPYCQKSNIPPRPEHPQPNLYLYRPFQLTSSEPPGAGIIATVTLACNK